MTLKVTTKSKYKKGVDNMSNIYTMIKTPTLVAEKGHESVKKRFHVSSANTYKVRIGLILMKHDLENCGVLELCRKCGFDDSYTLSALRSCSWSHTYIEYATDRFYVELLSCYKYIARINLENKELRVTQEIADMLDGRYACDRNTCIQHIVHLACFCHNFRVNLNNIAGVYNPDDKYNN